MAEKILLLEDDAAFRQQVLDTLEDEDYRVVDVGRPEEAIEAARWTDFDLLITDVRMAGATDGIGALEAIKKLRPSIFSIVMTGWSDDDAPVRAMRNGADHFLMKPFERRRFLGAVEQVLATRSIDETIQYQLKSFWSGARRALERAVGRGQEEVPQLETTRLAFFKSYYAGMQSGSLTVFGGLRIWDRLVRIEANYEALLQILGERAQILARGYRELNEESQQLALARQSGACGERAAEVISPALFERLYQRVRGGRVSGPTLMVAPLLWNLSRRPQRPRNQHLSNLWNQMFGAEDQAARSRQLFHQLLQQLGAATPASSAR